MESLEVITELEGTKYDKISGILKILDNYVDKVSLLDEYFIQDNLIKIINEYSKGHKAATTLIMQSSTPNMGDGYIISLREIDARMNKVCGLTNLSDFNICDIRDTMYKADIKESKEKISVLEKQYILSSNEMLMLDAKIKKMGMILDEHVKESDREKLCNTAIGIVAIVMSTSLLAAILFLHA